MTPITAIFKLFVVVLLAAFGWVLIPTEPTVAERLPVALGMCATFAAGALFQGIRWRGDEE